MQPPKATAVSDQWNHCGQNQTGRIWPTWRRAFDTERERYKAEAARYRDRFKSIFFTTITIMIALL